MPSDRLLSAAFEFRKVKLWDRLTDHHVFAVELSGGETAWCYVTGMMGEHFSLVAHLGDEGLRSLLEYFAFCNDDAAEQLPDAMRLLEAFSRLQCLTCSYEDKEMLPEAELEAVRSWKKSHRVTTGASRNSWPLCTTQKRFYSPAPIIDPVEDVQLAEALEAAAALGNWMMTDFTLADALTEDPDWGEATLRLYQQDGRWQKTPCHMPEEPAPVPFPQPVCQDDFLVQYLLGLPHQGTWQLGLYRMPQLVESTDRPEQGVFPVVFIGVNDRGEAVNVHMNHDCDGEAADELLEKLLHLFLEQEKALPLTIIPGSPRTAALLRPTCQTLHIQLDEQGHPEELEQLASAMTTEMAGMQAFGEDTGSMAEAMLSALEALSVKELREMPQDMKEAIQELYDEIPEVFSPKLLNKLEQAGVL